MKDDAEFWDKKAAAYAKRPVSDREAYEKKLQITREYLREDMEVLEFGCGTGSTAIAHAPYVKHILATDISSKMLAIAQDKADAAEVKNITFKQATLESLDLSEQSFDVVLGLSVLHLVENKEAAITSVFRLLKPGGVFISSTACLGESMKFFKFLAPVGKRLGLLPVLKVFTVQELVESIVACGFEIERQWQPGGKMVVFLVAKKAR